MRPRDVIKIWDKFTRPEKPKIHICVCPVGQKFLRINSNPTFPPHHLLLAGYNSFLDHDSYVELNRLLRHRQFEIAQSQPLGVLSQREAHALLSTVWTVPTFTEDEKQFIDGPFEIARRQSK